MSTNPHCRRELLCHWTRANAEWGRMAQNGATNTQSSGWVLTQFLLICGCSESWFCCFNHFLMWMRLCESAKLNDRDELTNEVTDSQKSNSVETFVGKQSRWELPHTIHRSLVCILRSDCIHVCLMMFIAINIYLISKSDKARKDNPWCGSSSQSLSQCARTEGSKRGSLLPTTH